MEIEEMLNSLRTHNVQIEVAADGHFRLRAAKGVVTIELIDAVRAHRRELIAQTGMGIACGECGELLLQGWCSKHGWPVVGTCCFVQSAAIN